MPTWAVTRPAAELGIMFRDTANLPWFGGSAEIVGMAIRRCPRREDSPAVRAAFEQGIHLYNAGDIDAYAQEYTEDAVLVRPEVTVVGRAAIGELWRREKAMFPDRTLRIDALLAQGDLVMAEWTWTGTNAGARTAPDGSLLPPSGRRVQLRGMELAQMRDGRICSYRMYWDRLALQQQLGMGPPEQT